MSETAEDPRPVWPHPPTVILGHESSLIAQPSTFLLPRGPNLAMQDKDKPLSAVDKDQLSGLVSAPFPHAHNVPRYRVRDVGFMSICERTIDELSQD